jgi:hypothetical protein
LRIEADSLLAFLGGLFVVLLFAQGVRPVAQSGTYFQPIKLSGARDKVKKKTYIRAPRFAVAAFNKALAECRADPSWSTVENATSGHVIMIDDPEWLADVLMKAA